jgi:transposase-like protein
MLTHDELKKKILSNPDVKAEYDFLEEEFSLFDELLKARMNAATMIDICQVKYLNNIIEQDHRFIKKITKPMIILYDALFCLGNDRKPLN